MRTTGSLLAVLLAAALGAAAPARALTLDEADADDGADDGPAPIVTVDSYASQAAVDPTLQRALRELYTLDYAAAESDAEVFLSSNPANPYGELFISGEIWWRGATEALTADDDPQLAQRFAAHTRAAVKKSKRLFKAAKPRLRAEAYFVAGMALGLQGQWRLTNRQWFKAYLDGKRAIKYLRKAVAIDPGLHDANLGLGIFDYQAAVLPGVLKLGALLLVRGDRERGLTRIQDAVANGQFASQQAASFLLTIYQTHERDYARGLELTARLRRDFPESAYLEGVDALLKAGAGDQPASLAVWMDLYGKLASDPQALRRKAWAVVCGAYGESCLAPERLAAAQTWLDAALADPPADPPPPGWSSVLRLMRGMALDARRQVKFARQDYIAVRDDANAPAPLRGLAAACLERACTRDRLFSLRKP